MHRKVTSQWSEQQLKKNKQQNHVVTIESSTSSRTTYHSINMIILNKQLNHEINEYDNFELNGIA